MRNFFAITILFLAACGQSAAQQNADDLASWKGQPVDRLVFEWGPPTSTWTMQNGRTVMSFEHEVVENDYSYDDYGNRVLEDTTHQKCTVNWITDTTSSFLIESKVIGDASVCEEMITPP
jgi:hypothetical protein